MEHSLVIPSVTGIDLEMRIAGPGGRAYAFIIDWNIRLLLALAWYLSALFITTGTLLPGGDSAGGGDSVAMVLFPPMVIYLLYHPIVEIAMRGRTPGKRIAGVRIISLEGEEPGVGALLVRNVMRLLDSMPFAYIVGLTATIMTRRAVRIGDLAAGTVLVYEQPQLPAFETSIRTESVARLGIAQVQLLDDLMQRWTLLDPSLAVRMAVRLLARLAPDQPAPTTDIEAYEQLKALRDGS